MSNFGECWNKDHEGCDTCCTCLTCVDEKLKNAESLIKACEELKADLLMRGSKEKNECGSECVVVDVSQGRWHMFKQALDKIQGKD